MSTAATGAARPAPAPGARPRSLKDMLAVNFGNALEWYDWNVYTIFAPVFAAQIFHADNPTSDLLATLAVFAVGFVARPIGGYVFGAYADRVGRRPLVIAFGLLFVVLPFPLFGMLDDTFASFLLVQTIALLAVALLFGVNGAVWSEVLPTAVRAKGVATMLSLATAIFGGTAPYLITWLTAQGWTSAFPIYLMVVGGLTGLTGLFMKETKDVDLAA